MDTTTRRRWALAAAGALALGAGAGLSWWQSARGGRDGRGGPGGAGAGGPAAAGGAAGGASGAAAAGSPLPAGFWAQQFQQPDGQTLALQSLQGRPLLINFWATWCPPCVRELPRLSAFQQAQDAQPAAGAPGLKLLGLAVDSPTPVREFIARSPIGFTVALAGLDGLQLVRDLGNDSGGLPFSVLVGRAGTVLARHAGELQDADLQRWAALAQAG